MNIVRPHGLVERMGERQRKRDDLRRYGRGKDGSPKDTRTWKIARDNDRRDHDRHDHNQLRGSLVDMNA